MRTGVRSDHRKARFFPDAAGKTRQQPAGTHLFSWAVGTPIADNQSGYRLIGRSLLERLTDSHESGFEFEVEMIVACLKNGFSLDWVPIRTIYAGEKSHIQPLKHLRKFVGVTFTHAD
jgi:hypothetical protein